LRETIARVLRSYGFSPRGADTKAALLPAAPADPAVTDADFDPAPWRGGSALCPSGLRRIVVRELPEAQGTSQGTFQATFNGSVAVRAVIPPPALTDRSILQQLDDQGVQGLRFPLDAGCDPNAILGWAERIVALGWHIEIELPHRLDAARLTEAEWALLQAPVPTCFSGLAGFVGERETDDAEIAFLLELVEMGRFWLKLSGAEIAGAQPATRNALHRLVDAAMTIREDRLVWGSGPPSASGEPEKHLDTMIDTLRQFLPDPVSRSRVLWSNPAALYHF